MPDELYLPVVAAITLVWWLVCALRQSRSEAFDEPEWANQRDREATAGPGC
jgi:hypothetical protein